MMPMSLVTVSSAMKWSRIYSNAIGTKIKTLKKPIHLLRFVSRACFLCWSSCRLSWLPLLSLVFIVVVLNCFHLLDPTAHEKTTQNNNNSI